MNKYIDAEKLKYEIEIRNLSNYHTTTEGYEEELYEIIDSLQQEQVDMGEVSDGYHTFNELYYYRMLYNAAFFNLLPKWWVHKSKRHHTGEECFGGGWFIVMANLPTGQISNHYELKDWDLFKVPEKELADEWDGHTPQEAAERIHKYLQQEQPEQDITEFEKALDNFGEAYATLVDRDNNPNQGIRINAYHELVQERINEILFLAKEYVKQEQPQVADASKMEQPEVDLEKEIELCWMNWLSPSNQKEVEGILPKTEFETYARHFAEWGAIHLNVRKEE